jgi:type IV secretory pathway VirB10-like protein
MSPSTQCAQAALLVWVLLAASACHRHAAHAAPLPSPPPAETPAPAAGAATAPPAGKPAAEQPAKPEESPEAAGPEAGAPPAKPPTVKPRPAAPTPEQLPPAEPPAPKPAPPQIAPQLSPAQEAELRRKTERAIAEAQGNLQRAYGRPLSDAQKDMVDKIENFLSQAREASQIPDWGRALILADKARLLSAELVNSL